MPWDEKQLHWHLTTRRFGRQCRYFDEIDSTNHWLLANTAEFTLSGAVVVAGHQTHGRGRYDRAWEDESGQSLLCSLLLQMSRPSKAPGWLPMLPAIALARTIRRHDPHAEVALKWPNDVLIENCKVAGVLAETVTGGGSHDIVVGIGINIRGLPSGLEERALVPPTSLFAATEWRPSRETLLANLLNEWEPLFDIFLDEEWAGLRAAWDEFGPRPGTSLMRTEAGESIVGKFMGLGDDGRLILKLNDGTHRELYSGDISFA